MLDAFRMFKRAHSALLAMSLGLGLVSVAETGRADASEPSASKGAPWRGCEVTIKGEGKVTLPSNAPALLLEDRTTQGLVATLTGDLVREGKRIPFAAPTKDAHGLFTLPLPSPAVVGTQSVDLDLACSDERAPTEVKATLVLGEPVAFPTSTGTLTHVPQAQSNGIDKVTFEPTPSMRAFLPAAMVTLTANGVASPPAWVAGNSGPISLEVHTGAACVENGVLHRDKRVVQVKLDAYIAGVNEAPLPATLDVPVDCGAISWTSEREREGSSSSGSSSGSSGTSSTSPQTKSESAATCAVERVGSAGSATPLVALALAALVVGARRRRRV